MKIPSRAIAQFVGLLLGVCGGVLVCATLVWLTARVKATPPATQNRTSERLNILTNVTSAGREILENYAWQDTDKGFVRLPLERAKELTVEDWKNPTAARSNLMARAAVLLAVPPAPQASTNLSQ